MPPVTRTSLQQIAETVGISRMAVSLALRGKPGVSAATRKRVLKAAAKLGYIPDPEVAKLMAHIRTKRAPNLKACLALLTSGERADQWREFLTERKYVEGARARALEYGYGLEEFWLNEPRMSGERLSRILWNRGIEGVIVAPVQGNLAIGVSRTIDLDFDLFAAVEISETVSRPGLDRSLHDQYNSMLTALTRLTALGYVRPGLVIEHALDLRTNGKWTAAFLNWRFSKSNKIPPPLLMVKSDARKFRRWMERHAPDVIISVDGLGYRLLRESGWRIGRDIGYASLDLDGEDPERKGICGIDQNSHLVGAAATDALVNAIQRGQRGVPARPLRIEVEGDWHSGTTALGPSRKR